MAYARKTSEVGVATVTCGPGVSQLITALPAAVRAHLPMVVFAGEAPLKKRLVQPGYSIKAPLITATGAAYHQLAPARAHAGCDSRCVPAGTPRTTPGGDSAFRSICRTGSWTGPEKSADALAGNCCRVSRRSRRMPDDVAQRCAKLVAVCRTRGRCSQAWVRSKPRQAAACRALAAKTGGLADHDTACTRTVPRRPCTASGSRAASRPRSGSSTSRKPIWSSWSAARSPITPAAAVNSGAKRRCCTSISIRSRWPRARKWRVTTCAPMPGWAWRH